MEFFIARFIGSLTVHKSVHRNLQYVWKTLRKAQERAEGTRFVEEEQQLLQQMKTARNIEHMLHTDLYQFKSQLEGKENREKTNLVLMSLS